jgi:hypothetical protein
MTFVDLFQNLVTNWKRMTVCSTELTPPSTTKIALITFLGAILLPTPSWVVFAYASRRTNGVNVCIPSLIFTPCCADHRDIDCITRSYRWWNGFMFSQCRFINRRMPTRVSRRVRIHHRWWPFLAYPDLGKWLWRMTAYQNTSIDSHLNVRRAKSWMRRMMAAFASLSAPRLLPDLLAVSDIVHIFVPSNV